MPSPEHDIYVKDLEPGDLVLDNGFRLVILDVARDPDGGGKVTWLETDPSGRLRCEDGSGCEERFFFAVGRLVKA